MVAPAWYLFAPALSGGATAFDCFVPLLELFDTAWCGTAPLLEGAAFLWWMFAVLFVVFSLRFECFAVGLDG